MSRIDVPAGESGSRQYPHAPIVEAVLEMRVVLSTEIGLDDLGHVGDVAPEFEVRNPFTELTGSLNFAETGVTTHTSQMQTGFSWATSDGQHHFQARRDAFLYMQMGLYSHWGEFTNGAERLWLRYKEIAHPDRLVRIGARFVNRVDIPHPSVELKDYFRTTAEISPDLPQLISGYLFQVQLPQVAEGISATIISTLVPPPEGRTSVILDIDTWCELDLSPTAPSFDDELRGWLGALRRAKNDVFEACITDATRELFL